MSTFVTLIPLHKRILSSRRANHSGSKDPLLLLLNVATFALTPTPAVAPETFHELGGPFTLPLHCLPFYATMPAGTILVFSPPTRPLHRWSLCSE